MDADAIIERLRGGLLSNDYLRQVVPLCQERIDTLEDFFSYAGFFFVGEVAYDTAALEALVPKGRAAAEVAKLLLSLLEKKIDPLLDWSPETVEAELRALAEDSGWSPKELFMAVRVAVTGRSATPPLFETLAVLGKEVCRRRLRRAAEALRSAPGPA
jgi:glutamyl-tRNA synthetase